MFSRLRHFLKSVIEDDWAGAWHAPEQKPGRANEARAQKPKPGRNEMAAPDAEDGAEADGRAKLKDRE